MTPSHTIRLLTPSDALAYTQLRRESLIDSPWAFIRSPDDDPRCNEELMAKSLSATRGYSIAGAFADDSRLVGATGIMQIDVIKAAHHAFIWGVYVSPDHRRFGLARKLMTAAIDAAKSWPPAPPLPKVEIITLSVSERSTVAQQLYASLGFTVWGTEPDAVRLPGHPAGYAEHHMLLRLH